MYSVYSYYNQVGGEFHSDTYSPLFEHLECHIIGRQGNECGGTVLIHQSSDMNSDSLEGLHREW